MGRSHEPRSLELAFARTPKRALVYGISQMGPEIEVEISNTQGQLRVDAARLETLVRIVLAAEARSRASISIALVDNAAIHALNRTHLGHDWPTDVISFPFSAAEDPVLTGEVVVSAEMARTVRKRSVPTPAMSLPSTSFMGSCISAAMTILRPSTQCGCASVRLSCWLGQG